MAPRRGDCLLSAVALLISRLMDIPEPIVTVRNLSKIYAQGEIQVTALNQISLTIAAGEFLTLMGPSGSGKSTLLHIIAGVDRPTSGECLVQGVDVTQLNESELADWRNQNVGFVFQTFNLIPVLTAFENVELPLLLTRLGSAQRRSTSSGSLTGCIICPGSFPADRSSAWPLPAL
jgi:ABC-type lipoprotein export system ATPase subunit